MSGWAAATLNAASVASAVGLASRIGLLTTMLESRTPRSISDWSKASGAHPRYVGEIFGVLVSGSVVKMIDADPALFEIAPDKCEELKGMGTYFEEMPLLHSCAFHQVSGDAKEGKGVAHGHYLEFHKWMGKLAEEKHQRLLISKFIPLLDGGKVQKRLEEGCEVLDLGCGEGECVRLMAKAFPNSKFVGIDIAKDALSTARSKSEKMGLQNTTFLERDATALENNEELRGRFDLITSFDAMHDFPDPPAAMRGMSTLLKPDGKFAMVDIRAETGLLNNR